MSRNAFQPDTEELNYFVVAVLVVGAAFTAFRGVPGWRTGLSYLGIAALVLLTREIGQRVIAQWMDAQVEMKLSVEGSVLTVLGSILAVLTNLPFILLFPVSNSFSMVSYEQWGKDIDVVWSKREAQYVSGGIVALLFGWFVSYSLGYTYTAQAFSLFTLFQLLPFDYSGIPTGKLDGAYILRSSGFRWITFFTVTLITLALV